MEKKTFTSKDKEQNTKLFPHLEEYESGGERERREGISQGMCRCISKYLEKILNVSKPEFQQSENSI